MNTTKVVGDSELERLIQQLSRTWKKSTGLRQRFAERRYLVRVYRTFWSLRRSGRLKRQLLKFQLGRTLAGGQEKPIHLLIAITSSEPDRRKRSRWARALEAAAVRNVPPRSLEHFLCRCGGVAGAAAVFATPTRPARDVIAEYAQIRRLADDDGQSDPF